MWEILTRITPFAELKNSNAIVKYVAVDKGRPRMSDIPAHTNKEVGTTVSLAYRSYGSLLGQRSRQKTNFR